eukprot:g176.t1
MPRFKTSDVADEKTEQCTFAELSLSTSLLRSLQEMGCEHPSPVQLHSIPLALGGGDVIIQAKSGTGKTIAFCSVVLEGIDTSTAGSSQAVILAPTREIAMQISDELSRLGWYLDPPVDVGCFIGGVPIEEHEERLSNCSPHVAVGSPGRTLKLLRDGILLTDARFLVLDEADKLLDSYFRQDIFAITEMVFTKQLQFLAVSATFPPPLVAIAEDLFVHVEKKHATRGQPIERELPHKVFLCTSAVKKDEDGLNIDELDQDGEKAETALLKGVLHVRYVLEGYHVRQKLPALLEVLTTASYQQAFVFVADSNNAIQIAEMLNQAGVPAAASGGKMEQSWRTQAFAGLKRFQYRVLVCTDLMARGIDAENFGCNEFKTDDIELSMFFYCAGVATFDACLRLQRSDGKIKVERATMVFNLHDRFLVRVLLPCSVSKYELAFRIATTQRPEKLVEHPLKYSIRSQESRSFPLTAVEDRCHQGCGPMTEKRTHRFSGSRTWRIRHPRSTRGSAFAQCLRKHSSWASRSALLWSMDCNLEPCTSWCMCIERTSLKRQFQSRSARHAPHGSSRHCGRNTRRPSSMLWRLR